MIPNFHVQKFFLLVTKKVCHISFSLTNSIMENKRVILPPNKLVRNSVKFNVDNRFTVTKSRGDKESLRTSSASHSKVSFSRQYCYSYRTRLTTVQARLEESVKKLWKGVELKNISNLLCTTTVTATSTEKSVQQRQPLLWGSVTPTTSSSVFSMAVEQQRHGQHLTVKEKVPVALIGVLFKFQSKKPSILQELDNDKLMGLENSENKSDTESQASFISDDDYLQLEDGTGTIKLSPALGSGITTASLVTGIVLAVKGVHTSSGTFIVTSTIFPTPHPQPILAIPKPNIEIVFVSGLNFGSCGSARCDEKEKACNMNRAKISLLFDYLEGLGGSFTEVKNFIQQKALVIFVGGVFGNLNSSCPTVAADIASQIDEKLYELSKSVNVLLMPSESDPSPPMFPQLPIHRCVLPKSSSRPSFTSMTNPALIELEFPTNHGSTGDSVKMEIVLSSGENVNDILQNSDISSPLAAAEKLLKWGHLLPTAPDTLPLYPVISESDAFFLQKLPDLFVIGNQKKFEKTQFMNSTIITVPKFYDSSTVVIMTKDMEFIPLHFHLSSTI